MPNNITLDPVSNIPGPRMVEGQDIINLSKFANVLQNPVPQLLVASGTIPQTNAQLFMITKGSAAALTLAAPTAGAPSAGGQDGMQITIISSTAFAHTVTATGLLRTGSAFVNVATFAANAGASLDLIAYNGAWYVIGQVGITFS